MGFESGGKHGFSVIYSPDLSQVDNRWMAGSEPYAQVESPVPLFQCEMMDGITTPTLA
jgi:hypothetical protein